MNCKKLSLLFISGVSLISLTGCGESGESQAKEVSYEEFKTEISKFNKEDLLKGIKNFELTMKKDTDLIEECAADYENPYRYLKTDVKESLGYKEEGKDTYTIVTKDLTTANASTVSGKDEEDFTNKFDFTSEMSQLLITYYTSIITAVESVDGADTLYKFYISDSAYEFSMIGGSLSYKFTKDGYLTSYIITTPTHLEYTAKVNQGISNRRTTL